MSGARGASGSSSQQGALVAAVVAGVVVGASAVGFGAFFFTRRRDERSGLRHRGQRDKQGERTVEKSWQESDLQPPLPPDVVRLLQSSRLCFLSTFCNDHPHLSLMNFTYCPHDEVIILSTRRDTKKYKLVQNACNVAILVHDFSSDWSKPQHGTGDRNSIGSSSTPLSSPLSSLSPARSRKLTITLNGSASIQEGELAKKYREMHAENNPNSKTFIIGDNIAMITVRVKTARICNIHDQVTFWDVASSAHNA